MNKTSKNFKILALILLTSALLMTANVGVKAASTTSVYVYTTFGGTIAGNGTALTGGALKSYTTGDTINFTATASSGFKFLCFEYIAPTGASTSTSNPFLQTISSSSCAIEAIFTPTTNTTAAVSGSGTATVSTMLTAGGDTVPAVTSGQSAGTYTNYTVGSTYPFKAVASTDFKFLCWITASTSGSTTTYNLITTANTNIKITSATVAIQALFIPTGSTVTVPTISEISTAVVAVLAVALVVSAVGTYAYTKKARK